MLAHVHSSWGNESYDTKAPRTSSYRCAFVVEGNGFDTANRKAQAVVKATESFDQTDDRRRFVS